MTERITIVETDKYRLMLEDMRYCSGIKMVYLYGLKTDPFGAIYWEYVTRAYSSDPHEPGYDEFLKELVREYAFVKRSDNQGS